MPEIFTVFGATGRQGGALIKYLLTSPRFSSVYHVRGITRDESKPAAIALQEQGVEVVTADMDDHESLKAAVAGSYAVFAMTNYWDSVDAAVETRQGKAIADAAINAGAELLIWSSLMRTGEAYFDSKADVEDYIRMLPIKSLFFMPGWFMQTFLVNMKPKARSDGIYVMAKPWPTANANTFVPLVDIRDIGLYLQPFLQDPEKYNHAVMIATTDFYTPAQMCETWTRITGTKVTFDGSHDDVSDSKMPPQQKAAATQSNVREDSSYYSDGGMEKWRWTLAQMQVKPTTWEQFVVDHEPWFSNQ